MTPSHDRFDIDATPLAGLMCVTRRPLGDARGWLERLYCPLLLSACGIAPAVAQINRTFTRAPGTLRGLHFQHPPHAETKLVQCLRGAAFDVAVDLRRGSPTFLQWHGETISADNGKAMLIPAGFAHGVQVLEPDTELLYVHTAAHVPDAEDGLDALDPRLGIDWPIPVTTRSERDRQFAPLSPEFEGIRP